MKKYLKTGIGLVGAGVVVNSLPNFSGTEAEAGLKGNFTTGLSNVGKALPVYGNVVGTGMVINSVGTLNKSMKGFNSKLNMVKGGRKKRR